MRRCPPCRRSIMPVKNAPSLADRLLQEEMSSPRTDSLRLIEQISLEDLLVMMMERRASDLHLAAGSPPLIRVDGDLQPMPFSVLTPPVIQTLLYAILTDVQISTFERGWELDFSYSLPGLSRFRINLHRQRGSVGGHSHRADGSAQPGCLANAASDP